jgi:hypothetical protein
MWRHGKQPAQKKRLGRCPGLGTVARFNREQMHVFCCRFYTQYVPVCMTKALEGQVRTHKIRIRMPWLEQAARPRPARTMVDFHRLLYESQICKLWQLGEFWTLVVAKTAEWATTLTPVELQVEAEGLRDELIVLSGDLKKYGHDFTKNLYPLLGDVAVAARCRHLHLLISI